MKRTDVKTGVVYSYNTRQSATDAGTAIVVLDISTFYQGNRGGFGTDKNAPAVHLPNRQSWAATEHFGFLAVAAAQSGSYWKKEPPTQKQLDALLKVTKEDVLKVRGTIYHAKVKDMTILLANPRFIKGPWEDVADSASMVQAERDRQDEEVRERSRQRVAAAQERVDRLRALNLPGEIEDIAEKESYAWRGGREWQPIKMYGNAKSPTLTWEQLDALLSLIPPGATWQDSDVEDDGWTFKRVPYMTDED